MFDASNSPVETWKSVYGIRGWFHSVSTQRFTPLPSIYPRLLRFVTDDPTDEQLRGKEPTRARDRISLNLFCLRSAVCTYALPLVLVVRVLWREVINTFIVNIRRKYRNDCKMIKCIIRDYNICIRWIYIIVINEYRSLLWKVTMNIQFLISYRYRIKILWLFSFHRRKFFCLPFVSFRLKNKYLFAICVSLL